MKKLKKYIAMMFCLVLMISSLNITVKAESIEESSKLTQEKSAETIIKNNAKGNILNEGLASIANNGNGTVNVYGAVYGSVICDKMILELTLQRYSNGSWSNVKSFSATAYNTGLLTKSYNVSVSKGYYYRVKAACVAQKGGSSESQMPVTDGIWIK
nr:DUF6147 family protein [uncultured Blautia sp.]